MNRTLSFIACAAILIGCQSCSHKTLTAADAVATPIGSPVVHEPIHHTTPVLPAPVNTSIDSPVMGAPAVSAEQMWRFVRQHNPDFPIEIAEAFYRIGNDYGIRGDVALCQSILETGWFKFADGTRVTPDQFNYCGMGVVTGGSRGESFRSMEEGVRAQMQHLYAYATTADLPEGEELVDPRFKYVKRGIAPTWKALSGKWASNPEYAKRIMKLYEQLSAH